MHVPSTQRDRARRAFSLLSSLFSKFIKKFSFSRWLEDSVGNIHVAKPVPSNPQNSRNLGFETGESLLSVVVGVPSGDVALDRIDRASKETTQV